jgi:putative oxidoreductase
MDGARNFVMLVGRVLLALIFVLSGLNKLMHPAMTAGYMTHAGIAPNLAYPGLYASIFVEFICGLAVMFGVKARWAAVIIFLWFIPVTLLFHVLPYREAVSQGQAMAALQQQINFMKNISIMGGLLMLFAMGPGAISLDARSAGSERAQALRAA